MMETKTEATEVIVDPDPIETKPVNPAALVPVTPGGIAIRNLEELMKFSAMVVRGGAAPKGWSDGQVAVAIQAGLERGLGLLGGLTQCVVINGVLSWRGQAAYALIQNSGKCKPGTLKKWTEGKGENMKGVAVAHRVGYKEPFRVEFTVKDAKQAHLWGKAGPWTEYPERQLAWRALGFLGKDYFSDVLGGFPIEQEAADYQELPKRATEHARAELPPPASPDPLMEVIAGKSVQAVPEPEKQEAEAPELETDPGFDAIVESELDRAPVVEDPAEAKAKPFYCPHGVGNHGKGCVECEAHEQS